MVILAGLGMLLAAAPASAGNGLALLKHIPEDVDALVALNLAKSRNTPLFRKGLEMAAKELGDAWKKLEAAKIDPGKDVDTILVSAYTRDEGPQLVVVIEGRLANFVAELRKSPAAMLQGLETWTLGDHAAIVVEKKLVFCNAPLLPAVVDTLKGKRGNAKASKKAKSLRTAVAAADTRGDGWAAVLGRAVAKELPVPGQVSWATLSLATSKGVAIEVKISADTEDTASMWASTINQQIPTVKPLLESEGFGSMADSIEAKNTGALFEVGLVMTDGEVTKAVSYLARQAGLAGGAKSP